MRRSRHGHLRYSQCVHFSWRLHGRGVFCWRGEVDLILKVVFKLLNKTLHAAEKTKLAHRILTYVLMKIKMPRIISLKDCNYNDGCIQNRVPYYERSFLPLLRNHTELKFFTSNRNHCGSWHWEHEVLLTLKLISRSLQQVAQLSSSTTVAARAHTDTTSKIFGEKGGSSVETTQNTTARWEQEKAYFSPKYSTILVSS